jgi:ABC-2 type transport system permease protein
MMKSWLAVFRYELMRHLKMRGYIFFTLALPTLALVAFTLWYNNQGNNTATQPTVSEDSPLQDFQRAVGVIDLASVLPPQTAGLIFYASQEEAQRALSAGEITMYYIIAPDYLTSGKIDAYFDRLSISRGLNTTMRDALLNALGKLSNADQSTILRLQERQLNQQQNIVSSSDGQAQSTSEGVQIFVMYLFVLSLLFTAFLTSGYLMQSVVEEKENRIVEILLSSMRPRDLLLGKFAALSLLGLMQITLWGAAIIYMVVQLSRLFPQVSSALTIGIGQPIPMLAYFVLGYLFFSAAYAAIGALATNMREGPQFAVFITLPAMLPMYFLPAFSAAPNAPLPVILSMFPVTAPVAMVARLSVTTVPVVELLISITLLVVFVGLLIWLAGRFFRVNTLLAGQPPSLKGLLQLVREK